MNEVVSIRLYSEAYREQDPRGFHVFLPDALYRECADILGIGDPDPWHFVFRGDKELHCIAQVRQLLVSSGYRVLNRIIGGQCSEPVILFGHTMAFSEQDMESAILFVPEPWGYPRVSVDRDTWWSTGRSIGEAKRVSRNVHIGTLNMDPRRLVISGKAKSLFEEAGVSGIHYREVELTGKKIDESDRSWILETSLELPPVTDNYVTGSDDHPIVCNEPPTDGICLPDVDWNPPVYRYSKSSFPRLDSDLARTSESFGISEINCSPVHFVSPEIRELCRKAGWEIGFRPVVLVDEASELSNN